MVVKQFLVVEDMVEKNLQHNLSYSFNKNHRLLKKKCFQRVISCNKKKNGRFIKIYYRTNTILSSKMGITASSYFGNAIERNFFKRRMREIFRLNKCNFTKPLEIVVYPQKKAKEISYSALKQEFISLIKEI